MNNYNLNGFVKQRGITLIELMTGLLIGLLVVAAALSSVIFTRSAQVTQSDSARIHQQASYVIRTIGLQLRQAGAVEMVNAADGKVTFDTRYTGVNDAQDVIVSGTDGGGTNPDVLNVSAQDQRSTSVPGFPAGTSTVRDCLGNAPDAALIGIRLQNSFSVNVAQQSLMCTGANTATGPQAIAAGVEDFQVRYGVATPGFTDLDQQLQYVATPPSFVSSSASSFRAVQICIRLVGDRAQTTTGTGNAVVGCNGEVVPTDGRIRRVFTSTYFLRNAVRVGQF